MTKFISKKIGLNLTVRLRVISGCVRPASGEGVEKNCSAVYLDPAASIDHRSRRATYVDAWDVRERFLQWPADDILGLVRAMGNPWPATATNPFLFNRDLRNVQQAVRGLVLGNSFSELKRKFRGSANDVIHSDLSWDLAIPNPFSARPTITEETILGAVMRTLQIDRLRQLRHRPCQNENCTRFAEGTKRYCPGGTCAKKWADTLYQRRKRGRL